MAAATGTATKQAQIHLPNGATQGNGPNDRRPRHNPDLEPVHRAQR
jgi:hypothetical protein